MRKLWGINAASAYFKAETAPTIAESAQRQIRQGRTVFYTMTVRGTLGRIWGRGLAAPPHGADQLPAVGSINHSSINIHS